MQYVPTMSRRYFRKCRKYHNGNCYRFPLPWHLQSHHLNYARFRDFDVCALSIPFGWRIAADTRRTFSACDSVVGVAVPFEMIIDTNF